MSSTPIKHIKKLTTRTRKAGHFKYHVFDPVDEVIEKKNISNIWDFYRLFKKSKHLLCELREPLEQSISIKCLLLPLLWRSGLAACLSCLSLYAKSSSVTSARLICAQWNSRFKPVSHLFTETSASRQLAEENKNTLGFTHSLLTGRI